MNRRGWSTANCFVCDDVWWRAERTEHTALMRIVGGTVDGTETERTEQVVEIEILSSTQEIHMPEEGEIAGRQRRAHHEDGHVLLIDDSGGMIVDQHLIDGFDRDDLLELCRQLLDILARTPPVGG